MGFYIGEKYHVAPAEEFDFFTLIIGHSYFIIKGLYHGKLIKKMINEEFSKIVNNILLTEIEIPTNFSKQDLEKLRLDFDNKPCVFNYYIKTTGEYNLYKKDKIYHSLERLNRDLDLNNNKYFQMRIIQDFLKDLETNVTDYLKIEKYKEYLENTEVADFSEDLKLSLKEEVIEKKLKNYITDEIVYENLLKRLIEINFLDKEGNVIKENKRLDSDLAILFIKLNDSKLINTNHLSETQIIQIIQNTFEASPSKNNYNKLKNKNLSEDDNLDLNKSNDKSFYRKLEFIDAIQDKT